VERCFSRRQEKEKPTRQNAEDDSAQTPSERIGETSFFHNLNSAALQHRDKLAPAIFGDKADYQPTKRRRRASLANLDRGLEEDVALYPDGIRDCGDAESVSRAAAIPA
jgi:hypothetical protein